MVQKEFPPSLSYSELINQGVNLYHTPSNIQRAQSMVNATGNKIGFMRSAKMGVFRIPPVNSTEISDYGINDVTSLYKKVTAVVSASFAIE